MIFVLPNTHPRTGHKTWHEQMSYVYIQLLFCILGLYLYHFVRKQSLVWAYTSLFCLTLTLVQGTRPSRNGVLCLRFMILILPNTHPRTGHKTWQEQISHFYIQLLLDNVMC